MKIYCTDCGQGTDYLSTKPKFCGNCGLGFAGATAAVPAPAPKRKIAPAPRIEAELDEDEDEDEDEPTVNIPQLSGLSVEITPSAVGRGARKQTIGDLAGTTPDAEILEQGKKKAPKVNRKQFMKDFQKEAGTLRPK